MHIASSLFAFLLKLGGIGLFVLGVFDSSYLFAPWGNDLLMIAMTARNPRVPHMLYYAAMSTAGSAIGCLLIDLTLRPLGEKGLERYLSRRKLQRIRNKIEHRAGWALTIASLAPPPFPFTAFVMGAAALQYSRRRLLAIVGATRMVRFTVLGAFSLRFGESILGWAKNPMVQVFLIGLIILCTAGSAVSVYGWIRRSKPATAAPAV